MNQATPFDNFLLNVLGFILPRNQVAIRSFMSNFEQLLATTEDELDSFVTNTHGSNTGRPAAQKITIPPNVLIGLKSILFELKDREIYGALPDLAVLNAIDHVQLMTLRQSRTRAKEHLKRAKDNALTDNMKIPKFKTENYDEFMTAFSALVSRIYGAFDIPLDYLLRENEAPCQLQ